jgi:hypothetical protein
MMRKGLVLVVAVLAITSIARAEPMRTVFTKDNKTPDLHQLEAGLLFEYADATDPKDPDYYGSTFSGAPYVRFGLVKNVSVFGQFPLVSSSPEFGSDERGFGDVTAGIELLAFQDIFDFPWVMPHASVVLPTGDEDNGLGGGETVVRIGAAAGTTVMDVLHWALDARYEFHEEVDSFASIAASCVWSLSDAFTLSLEGKATTEQYATNDKHPVFLIGGMSYKATDHMSFMVYGGGSKQPDDTALAGGKIAVSF